LTSLTGGLINEDYYSRYSPFGIMVSKQWLFAQGGRPVIYQSAEEYQLLTENHRWRHVLYETSIQRLLILSYVREPDNLRLKTDVENARLRGSLFLARLSRITLDG
jgi:hypothetical protein